MRAVGGIRYGLSVILILLLPSSCAGVSGDPVDTVAPPTVTTLLTPPTLVPTLPLVKTPTDSPTNTPATSPTPFSEPTSEAIDATSVCDISRDLGFERISVVGIVEKVDDAIWLADLKSDGCNLLIAVDHNQYNDWRNEVPEAFTIASWVWFDGILMVYRQTDGRLFDSHPPTPNPDGDYFILKVDTMPKVIEAAP